MYWQKSAILVTPIQSPSGPNLPHHFAHHFAKKIKDARGWQSSAVASAIDGNLGDAIDAGKLTSADVVTIIDEANLPSFSSLNFSCYPTKSHVGEGIKLMKTDRN
jgi:hypothetical protein